MTYAQEQALKCITNKGLHILVLLLLPGLASRARIGPSAWKRPITGLTLCCSHLEIRNKF